MGHELGGSEVKTVARLAIRMGGKDLNKEPRSSGEAMEQQAIRADEGRGVKADGTATRALEAQAELSILPGDVELDPAPILKGYDSASVVAEVFRSRGWAETSAPAGASPERRT